MPSPWLWLLANILNFILLPSSATVITGEHFEFYPPAFLCDAHYWSAFWILPSCLLYDGYCCQHMAFYEVLRRILSIRIYFWIVCSCLSTTVITGQQFAFYAPGSLQRLLLVSSLNFILLVLYNGYYWSAVSISSSWFFTTVIAGQQFEFHPRGSLCDGYYRSADFSFCFVLVFCCCLKFFFIVVNSKTATHIDQCRSIALCTLHPCLPAWLPVCLCTLHPCLPACLSVYSTSLSACMAVCLSVYSTSLSACKAVCLSV